MTRMIERHEDREAVEPPALPAELRATRSQRRRHTLVRGVAIAAAALLVGGVGGWAGATAFAPAPQVLSEDAFSTVAVARGEVGSSISLNAVASWATSPVALNGASGTVTSVDIEPGEQVEAGQRLYSVDLRPVVAAEGSIPAFGSIAPGDSGAQVTQLQQLMADLGYWAGGASGRYTAGFAVAVRNWQRAAGYPVDAVVQAGDIVWVPQLPARMSLEGTIAVGRMVAAGAGEVIALEAAPSFTIPMQQAQTRFAASGTRVIVQAPDGTEWEAVTSAQRVDAENSDIVHVELNAPDGGPVCASACDQIGVEGQTTLLTEIVTVPVEEGLVVPTSAISTTADGGAFVTDEAGERHEVSVMQSARGMALVEGVDEGLAVRIPAEQ